jgi:glycosyltransferase involved in cell wall biosynthesis
VISVVVNFFNNQRELPRTLHTLTAAYQNYDDFEVVVLDNGSQVPVEESLVRSFGTQFRLVRREPGDVSPAAAINEAVLSALGSVVVVMIDGAHMVSPGVYRGVHNAMKISQNVIVATTPFHLGPAMQNDSRQESYGQIVEDQLLALVDWREDGYQLFQVAAECADMSRGWLGCLFESCCFGMRRENFLRMGGYDTVFRSPGGGMVNVDFFRRAVGDLGRDYVLLVGEGSFHQFHGGVASNTNWEEHPWDRYHSEYEAVRGEKYTRLARVPFVMGSMNPNNLLAWQKTAVHGLKLWHDEFFLRPQDSKGQRV